jgi:hypothetical protein
MYSPILKEYQASADMSSIQKVLLAHEAEHLVKRRIPGSTGSNERSSMVTWLGKSTSADITCEAKVRQM